MKQHTKTLGQVFLNDPNIIRKIIHFASPKPTDTIIEIGCGKGALTKELCQIGPLHVIEIDERWLSVIESLNLPNTTLWHADALTVSFTTQFPKHCALIANIPYQITSPLIQHLANHAEHLGPITIMIQKEMGERLLAHKNTKQFGSMTLFASYYFDIQKGFGVSRQCFSPVPNVDSVVIKLTSKAPVLNPTHTARFFAMTRSFFWGRRKTMLNCLLNSPFLTCDPSIKNDKPLAMILQKRGESMDLSEHLALFEQVNPFIAAINSQRFAP